MGGLIQFFQQTPLAIPLFIVMFTAIIAVHEFGHYLTARLLGMRVLEFAFGFPPRAFAIRHGGIDYSVNWIPFGGFVRILGQDDFSIEQRGAGEEGSFTSKPWWAQAIVLAAGVFMNFVLAITVLTVAFAIGTTAPTGKIRVEEVAPNSPAAVAGIQPGDIVKSIDKRPITRTTDLVSYVTQHADKEVILVIERNGRDLDPITAVPRKEPPEGEGPLGIRLSEVQAQVAMSPPQAFLQALTLTGDVVEQIAELPGQLLTRAPGSPNPPPVGDIPQARWRDLREPRRPEHHPVPRARRRPALLRARRCATAPPALTAGRGRDPRRGIRPPARAASRGERRRHPPCDRRLVRRMRPLAERDGVAIRILVGR